MCRRWECPDCRDQLIHLVNRGADESSSEFCQYIHDELPNEFFLVDNDATIYKKKTRIMRELEHKYVGQSLSRGQCDVLPIKALNMRAAVDNGLVDEVSGVFVIWTDAPFSSAVVQRVLPLRRMELGRSFQIDGEQLRRFLSGERRTGAAREVEHNLGRITTFVEAA